MSIFRGNGGSGSSSATSVIIPVSQGGTGATTIAEARLNINAAKNGVNSDITQLLGLEQPLSVAQGGTGARDASVARTNLGAASSAQGALADTALQEADVATVALTGSYNDLLDIPTAGTGDVVGPASSTDGAVALFDGTTGLLLKDGVVLGTAATTNSTAYATAAQGTNADTAYGWGNHASAGYAADTAVVKLTGSTMTGDLTVPNLLPPTDNTGVVGNATYTWSSGQFTNLNVDSTLTVRAAIDLADGDTVRFGSSDDAYFVYNGTTNTFELQLEAAATDFIITDNGTTKFTFNKSTGDLTATSFIGDGSQLTGVNAGQYFGNATTKAIAYNSQTISENITVTSGNSGLSAGPITISSGYAVTIASGSRWVIV